VVVADRRVASTRRSAVDPSPRLNGGGGATGIATAALVHVHVPAGTAAGTYGVEVKAAGWRHAQPAEVIDRLTVRVRCSAR
jgi:hypothetical protein